MYRVLDNQTVIRNQGKFCKADLANIWHETKYATMQDQLLQLMLKFKLCYCIEHSKWYIAPQLLMLNPPNYEWDEQDNLLLRYQYTFMPKGIMTRLVVAMHHLIAEQRYVWRSGVVLQDEQTKAEVIEHYGKREINVRVMGRHKKRLMTKIEHELEQIHKSFKRLKYQKLIPCNCESCYGQQMPHFYAFDTLLKFRADRQLQIQCQNSYKMVDVLSLIDDLPGRTSVKLGPKTQPHGNRLNFAQCGELAKCLLAMPSMADQNSRSTVIDQLRAEIKTKVAKSPIDRMHVFNIVKTCLEYPNGIQELRDVLAFFEGDSIPMQRFKEALTRLLPNR